MECNFCKDNVSMPFSCSLCSQKHCSKHRLPEAHQCGNIGHFDTDTYRKQKLAKARLPRNVISADSLGYVGGSSGLRRNYWSSGNKNKDVAYAGILFGIVSVLVFIRGGISTFLLLLPFSVVYSIFGMFVIYFVRKRMCSNYNLTTRFLFWPIGVAITIIFGILGSVWFVMGYFFIDGESSSRSYGLVGVVSTLTSLGIFFTAFLLNEFTSIGFLFIWTGGKFLLISLLNMIPLWGLDGQRLYEWEPKYYWMMLIFTILLVGIFAEFVFQGFLV